MTKKTSAEIRQTFLDFFEERGHTVVPSSSLVPVGDSTLLFTNAGMNQFKNVFLGLEKRPYKQAVTAQKIMRVSGKHNDLENVGPSPRHHTLFEMLGNFSFGDYFKEDAIRYAWDLLTKELALPVERLWFTVYTDDDEAAELWQKVGANPERILRFGEKDNYWSMGDTGPCGPCSEVHFYSGPLNEQQADGINSDDPHYIEFWNLVFMQFNRDADGGLNPLPHPSVDTGMGLERIAMVMQGVESSYETDLFLPIMDRVQSLLGDADGNRRQNEVSYRVISDHTRALSFLIADGVLPANEGRGYIVRLLLRRAARHGRMLGFRDPFLAEVSQAVIETMGHHYTEIKERRELIFHVLTQEEERFQQTLEVGTTYLGDLIQRLQSEGKSVIPGNDAFQLYDTHGFPVDLTRDIAQENQMTVDDEGYQSALERQREQSRDASHFTTEGLGEQETYARVLEKLQGLDQVGSSGIEHPYAETMHLETEVLAILKDGNLIQRAEVGDQIEVVLANTPFYVESGGQVTDIGFVVRFPPGTNVSPEGVPVGGEPMWDVRIEDVRCPLPGLIVHSGQVLSGEPKVSDSVWALVETERRWDIMRNHTATHLLHSELRYVLGEHVHQAGSLVAPDRLRFDFTHSVMMTQEELDAVERSVNEAILAAYPVTTEHTTYKEAVVSGATALFGEKYGDVVRVVRIGWPDSWCSQELCGGTHANNTSEIGMFHIIGEASVGAGIRRIEAVTGHPVHRLAQENFRRLEATASYLGVKADEVDRRVLSLLDNINSLQKEIAQLRSRLAKQEMEQILASAQTADNGVTVVTAQVDAADVATMRELSDWLRTRLQSAVVVLGADIDGRPSLIAAITPDLVDRGLHAGKLVKIVAQVVGGGGGGKPTLAQAGGRDLSRLSDALERVRPWVEEHLSP